MLKKIFNLVGLNVERYRPFLGTQAEIYNAIKQIKTNIILDRSKHRTVWFRNQEKRLRGKNYKF